MSMLPTNTAGALANTVSTAHPATNRISGTTTEALNPLRSTLRPYRMVNTDAMMMHGAITNT